MEPNANVRLVSHYQIIMNPIGQGSYGAIYQARDQNNPQELLACKQVQCQLNKDNPRFVQIINEYQILKKISYQQQTHPNIVRMIEGLNQKGADVIYIFLEYCNEGDLENYIKHNWKKYSEKQILSIFKKIFSGCQYLQSESIMHRDLKPSNILLKDGQPKICDFGTAIEYTLDTQARFAGTHEYRAPELYADRGFYSEQAEVFSLGQILYQMIYNTTLGAKSQTQTLELQDFFDDVLQYNQFVFPQQPVISSELKQLLLKMLAYNPEQRAKFSDIQKFFGQREQNLKDSLSLVETQINQQIAFENSICQFYSYLTDQITKIKDFVPMSMAFLCTFLLLKRKAFHTELLKEIVSGNKNIFGIEENSWLNFLHSQEFMQKKVELIEQANLAKTQLKQHYQFVKSINLNQFPLNDQTIISNINLVIDNDDQIQFGKFQDWMNNFQLTFIKLLKQLIQNIEISKAQMSREIYKLHLMTCDNIMALLAFKKTFSRQTDFQNFYLNQREASIDVLELRVTNRIKKFSLN